MGRVLLDFNISLCPRLVWLFGLEHIPSAWSVKFFIVLFFFVTAVGDSSGI
jgi:hypothetical protein